MKNAPVESSMKLLRNHYPTKNQQMASFDDDVDSLKFIQTLEEQEDIQHDESANLFEKKIPI